ncbi:hypothetical protein TruAng_006583 [Truncatella angustata]|nr:hypothetical protein TruAng_006583 [Truncatella angustata]
MALSPAPQKDHIEWHPASLLNEDRATQRFALLILNQPLRDVETLKRLWANASLRVAADGGANRLYSLRGRDQNKDDEDAFPFIALDVIIGDLDSLTDTTREYYEAVHPSMKVIHDSDQYSTDFTKAGRYVQAARGGAMDIVAMGGLGGRVDQGLSQIHHLYMFQTSPTYEEGKMYLVSGESLTFVLKAGSHKIHVREQRPGAEAGQPAEEVFDKYAGIVPVKEPSLITLKGFEWDVEDWPTEFGGQISTSNHVLPESQFVEVITSKDVIFTIALKGRGDKG